MQYFYDCYLEKLGALCNVSKILCKLPGGQRLMGSILRKRFDKLARTEHGTLHFIEDNAEDHIDAYWAAAKDGRRFRIRSPKCSISRTGTQLFR